MKVTYFINQYPATTHTFIKREILALERRGVAIVRVAARCGRDLIDISDIDEADKTVHLLESRTALLKAVLWALVSRPRHFARALAALATMARTSDRPLLVQFAYLAEACALARTTVASGSEHIHAHFGTNPADIGLIAALIADVPFSFTVHGYDEFDRPGRLSLDRKTRGAQFVACVSSYGRSQMMRWCSPGDENKIALVRCGLDSGWALAPVDPPSGVRFVCVARLCREKAQVVLIEAIAWLLSAGRKCELVLVGDGEGRTAIETAIQDYKVGHVVRLLGWKDSKGVGDEIMSARALVVPSFAENLPVVIMEAMALGRPVVATTIAGIPELVAAGENGWLVPAGDVDALAAALADCLDTPDKHLAAMGAAGRNRVGQCHNVDREAAALAKLFRANPEPMSTHRTAAVGSAAQPKEELSWRHLDAPSPTHSNA